MFCSAAIFKTAENYMKDKACSQLAEVSERKVPAWTTSISQLIFVAVPHRVPRLAKFSIRINRDCSGLSWPIKGAGEGGFPIGGG